MPYQLIVEPTCGASGDMLLGALMDIVHCEEEFTSLFHSLGLDVSLECRPIEKNHLRCMKVDVHTPGHSHIRHFSDIQQFIEQAPFSMEVRKHALSVFRAIFEAEAAVHGEEFHHIHLHELGADDSLIDILGFCFLWERLQFAPIFYTTLFTGKGRIKTQHGILPVPPPAVLKLIEGKEFKRGEIDSELLTPTGAALLTTLGTQVGGDFPVFAEKTGIGAGDRTFDEIPNIVRVILSRPPTPANDQVWVLEFTIDDMTGEEWAHAIERIFEAGALDMFTVPGIMKKGRPAFQASILCRDEHRETCIASIFRETTTIGLRLRREQRIVLERSQRLIMVDGMEIRIKISVFEGQTVSEKPEDEDVMKFARAKGLPYKEASRMIRSRMNEKNES